MTEIATTFTTTCPCGEPVHFVDGIEQPHNCAHITSQTVRDAWAEGYAAQADLLAANVTSIAYLAGRLQMAVDALHEIAGVDYRGPRPATAGRADKALRDMLACECHATSPANEPSQVDRWRANRLRLEREHATTPHDPHDGCPGVSR